jgi:flagellar biosynthesis/type III secretory pathway M-ring protein FliF/YscJ
MSPADRPITPGMTCSGRKRRMRRRLLASLPVERTRGNNDAMVALALVLLVLVAVLVAAIVFSNPQIHELSIFGAIIPVNTAGIFITGAVGMAVTILALLLLRSGIRRARARRDRIKALEASDQAATSGSSRSVETSTTTTTKTSSPSASSRALEPQASRNNPATDLDSESSKTPAERQAMLDEADDLTREEPRK